MAGKAKRPAVLKSEMWPVDRLRPNPWNPNVMDERTFELTKRSILEDGFGDPVDVLPDGTIIDGEHRWRAAKELGMKEIPVFVKDYDPVRARISTVRKNKTRGEMDVRKLALVIADLLQQGGLSPEQVELELGFDQLEQEDLLKMIDGEWESTLRRMARDLQEEVGLEDWVVREFRLTADQDRVVSQALELAKKHGETDSDARALELICADYLAGAARGEDDYGP